MNILIDKTVRPHLSDKEIMNQIQYAVNHMMAGEEKERTTTQVQTMAGTFYVYSYGNSIYVMKKRQD